MNRRKLRLKKGQGAVSNEWKVAETERDEWGTNRKQGSCIPQLAIVSKAILCGNFLTFQVTKHHSGSCTYTYNRHLHEKKYGHRLFSV